MNNSGKFSKKVENTLEKEAIAHYEEFLFLPQHFQKTCTADTKKPGLVWERGETQDCAVKSVPDDQILDLSKFKAFAGDKIILTQNLKFVLGRVKHIVGKGKNAGYQHFLLFPQCFRKLSFPEMLKVGIVS